MGKSPNCEGSCLEGDYMASTSRTGNGNPRDLSQCGPNFVLRQSFILIGSTCIVGKKKYCCKGSRTHSNSSMTSTVSANVSMATASKEKQTVGVLYLSTQFYTSFHHSCEPCVLYTCTQPLKITDDQCHWVGEPPLCLGSCKFGEYVAAKSPTGDDGL